MANLKTVFRPEGEGVVTAGNSSQLTDGASAVLVVAYLALGTLRLRNTGSDIPETADGR